MIGDSDLHGCTSHVDPGLTFQGSLHKTRSITSAGGFGLGIFIAVMIQSAEYFEG